MTAVDPSRRLLRERDEARDQIDALRRALDLPLGAGLGLQEMAACLRMQQLRGSTVARAEELVEQNRRLREALYRAHESLTIGFETHRQDTADEIARVLAAVPPC